MTNEEEAKTLIQGLYRSMNAQAGFALPKGWEFTLIGKVSREALEQAVKDLSDAGYLDADGTLTEQGYQQWINAGA